MSPEEIDPYVEAGHGLADWLWALVSRDDGVRELARDVLGRMRYRGADVHSPTWMEDSDTKSREYGQAIRRAVDSPGFGARQYILELTDLMRAAQSARMAIWEEERARTDRINDRILARITDRNSEEQVGQALRRMMRVVCASATDPKNQKTQAKTRHLLQYVAASQIFGELDLALLQATDRLLEMLDDDQERYKAVAAIAKIGPAAADTLGDALFAHLDASESPRSFTMEQALAAVIRNDPGWVAAVVNRLGSTSVGVVGGALSTLHRLGPAARDLEPRCIPRLLDLASRPGGDCRPSAIAVLGTVGVGLDSLVEPMLEWSRDPDVWIKWAAIYGLGNIGLQPLRVVPRLIEAFDDYDEPDPDEYYYGNYARVCRALQVFGPAAAPAVPALVARLYPSDEVGPDKGILETLAAIGPPARDALPVLEKIARELGLESFESGDGNPLELTIRRIRGD